MAKQVISFHYTLKDKDGKTLDSSEGEPLMFLEGSGQIIPGLEKEIVTLKIGDKKDVLVPCKDAYGAFDETLVFTVPKEKFPKDNLKVGSIYRMKFDDGYRLVNVIDIDDSQVTLDANHPLAGQDLQFNVEITATRDATAEELEHGHAHGEGGHHHH